MPTAPQKPRQRRFAGARKPRPDSCLPTDLAELLTAARRRRAARAGHVGGDGAFSQVHRSGAGDARGSSQNNLAAEEPGGESQPDQPGDAPPVAPDVQQVCPATFGNSDIYGGSYPNPYTVAMVGGTP